MLIEIDPETLVGGFLTDSENNLGVPGVGLLRLGRKPLGSVAKGVLDLDIIAWPIH